MTLLLLDLIDFLIYINFLTTAIISVFYCCAKVYPYQYLEGVTDADYAHTKSL